MPLYRISRPAEPNAASTLGTPSGIRGALVAADDPAAAVAVANALAFARGYNGVFTSPLWAIVEVAATPGAGHVDTLVDGDFSTVRGVWPGR